MGRIVTDCPAKVSLVQGETEQPAGRQAGPELSVVICTVGRAAVEETVASVAASARAAGREVEILVVWQGAEGQGAPELDGATVTAVFPAGLAYARNRGLASARAPLVGFVDDDEIVDAGWVGALLDTFERVRTSAVFGPIAPRDDRGLPYCRYDGGGELRVVGGRRALPWTVGTGGNMAYRREELVELGGFDILFGLGAVARSAEDTELILRLLRAGHSVAWSPDVVVYHPSKSAEERLASRFPYAYGIGKLARRHRDAALAVRYAKAIVENAGRAVGARDGRRLRESRQTLFGFLAGVGTRARPQSPTEVVARAPDAIRSTFEEARVEPLVTLYRPDPHFMYGLGKERLLHLYVEPTSRLREGLAARERIRQQTGLRGIPCQIALGESIDALWVLEDRLPGAEPHPGDVGHWFDTAASWVLDLGGPPGAPVREGVWWSDEATAAVEVAPPGLGAAVSDALEMVGDLPSRRLHGDFQRKNILIAGDGEIGVADWEHAYEDGPPGLDLLFLALMATGDRPDREVVRAVSAGGEPAWGPFQRYLRESGLEGVDLRRYVLAALAVWAADERERISALGLPRSPRNARYLELLGQVGPSLA